MSGIQEVVVPVELIHSCFSSYENKTKSDKRPGAVSLLTIPLPKSVEIFRAKIKRTISRIGVGHLLDFL